MSDYRMVKTTREVWAVMRASHPEMKPFSSYSDPEGGDGQPRMETAYGFEGLDFPLLFASTTWEKGEKSYDRVNEKHEFWLCVGIAEEGA